MIIADEWLLDLREYGAGGRAVGELCILTQVRTFKQRGHVLALNDTLTKENIRRAARSYHVPSTIVRCLRCGCPAWFLDWMVACDLQKRADDCWLATYKTRAGQISDGFLMPCPGDEMAVGLEALMNEVNE